jgi:hypothetical protein
MKGRDAHDGSMPPEDNVEVGVVLMRTTMMRMVMTTTTGGATKMPDKVWDGFTTLLERDEVEFAPLRDCGVPLVGIAIGRGGGGG